MKLRYHLLATLTLALTTLLCNAMNNEEPLITEKIDEKKNLFLDNLYKCNVIKDMVKPDLKSLTEQKVEKQEFIKKSRKYFSKAFIALWEKYIDSLKEQNLLPENDEKLLDALTTIIAITPENPTRVCDEVSLNKISDYLNTLTFDQLLNLFPLCRFLDLDKKILKKVEEAFINKTVKQLSSSPTLPNKERLNHVLEDLCIEKKARLLPEPVLITIVNLGLGAKAATLSPDGKLVATISGNSAHLWDIKTNKCLHTCTHNGSVKKLTFSPNGTSVATVSGNSAQLWDIETGKCLHTFTHDNHVIGVNFSPNGKFIVTTEAQSFSGNPGCVYHYYTNHIWNLATGKRLNILIPTPGENINFVYVYPTSFSSDGKFVLTSSNGKTGHLWDLATGQCLKTFPHNCSIVNIAFGPDKKQVTTVTLDNTIRIWDLTTEQCLKTSTNSDLYQSGIIFAKPNGDLISFTESRDSTAKLFDFRTGKCLHTFPSRQGLHNLTISPSGKFLANKSLKGEGPFKTTEITKIWDLRTDQCLYTINDTQCNLNAFSTPDETLVVTSSNNKTAKIWRIKENLTLAQYITVLFLYKLKKEGKQPVFSQLNPMIANIARGLPPSIKRHYFPNPSFNRTMWTFFKTCGFVKNNPK